MAHFPVSTFLEEVSSFEKQDFEAAWSWAQQQDTGLDLSLFPMCNNDAHFDMKFVDDLDDPLLSSSAINTGLDMEDLLDSQCSPVLSDFCMEEPILLQRSPLEPEQPQEEDYPATVHSYCQPPRTPESEFNSNEENVIPASAGRKTIRRRRQRRANKRRTISSDADDDIIFSNGKQKLYTQKPFKNPELERARLNAINAKMNRDRKKLEAAGLRREVERLRKENEELKKSRSSLNSRATKAEEELARIKQVLSTSELASLLKWSSGN
jgi:hypothetical protein